MPSERAQPFQFVPEHARVTDEVAWLDPANLLVWLDDLRRRALIALASVIVAFAACFAFSDRIVATLLRPLREVLPDGAVMAAFKVPEVFLLHVKATLLVAIVLVLPMWLYHAWRLTIALVPRSRTQAFAPVAFLAGALFATGAAFGHFVLLPKGIRFLTTFGSDTVHVVLSVESVFALYSRFILGIGLAFQVPTVVYVLSRLRLVTPAQLARAWKSVLLMAFTLAAVVTPTPDVVTQSLLAFPLIVLYAFSIGLCWLVRGRAHD